MVRRRGSLLDDGRLRRLSSPQADRQLYAHVAPRERRSEPHYFLLGRCVSADPAAVFAAMLDFGSRRTLDAAEAAFLLVTSLFALRAMSITSFLGTTIRSVHRTIK